MHPPGALAARTMLRVPVAFGLALCVLLGLPPSALADSPPAADDTEPLVDVSGVAFHDVLGMCYLDHATCPFPWDAPANFAGPDCTRITSPDGMFVSCNGLWRDLWFNFLVPGGGAGLSRAGIPVAALGTNDLLHLQEMRGTVAMSCDFHATGPKCVTNFSGFAFIAEKWDCYVHDRETGGVDCPNDGP
jgi:hypothetical protein